MQSGIRLTATVLGARDPAALGRFYRDLLDWELRTDEPGWVAIRPADGGVGLSFQEESEHRPPSWPGGHDEQQMQMHLDIWAEDLEAACRRAEELGATRADFQPQENVRVLIDPAGHPFCLYHD